MDLQRPYNDLPLLPPAAELETRDMLKACIEAHKALASLRRATEHLPNPVCKQVVILDTQIRCAQRPEHKNGEKCDEKG